jgi:hypothetical protein
MLDLPWMRELLVLIPHTISTTAKEQFGVIENWKYEINTFQNNE